MADGKDFNSDDIYLDPEDIIEVIDIDDIENGNDDIVGDIADLELQNEEEEEEEDNNGDGDQEMVAGRDDSIITFDKHSGSVFCVSVDAKGEYVASGGEDDKAYIWKLGDGESVFECQGHKDSVVAVDFSHSCKYLATGDMSGLIKVWNTTTKEEAWSFEGSDLEWMKFHQTADVLFAGTADGEFWMWKIPSGETKTYLGAGGGCTCGIIMQDGKQACTGYEDGAIRFWDLKTGLADYVLSGKECHEGSVTSLDCHKDNILVLSGSTDVTAKIINSKSKKVLCNLNCSVPDESITEDSVEAVGFSKNQQFAATGTLSGMLNIWDIPTQVCRVQCKHDAGIVKLQWDPSSPIVYTSCLDGRVQLWDARSGKSENQWMGHNGEILDFDFTRDGNFMVTSSGDKTVKVYNVTNIDR